MTKAYATKTNFTAGELSPYMLGRGDLTAFENGAMELKNVYIHPTGGVSRRSGLKYIDTAPGNGRLIAFEYNTEQTYLLVFTNLNVDVYMDGVKMASFLAPWTVSQLKNINWTQSADTLWIVHPDVAPKKITRTSHSDWTVSNWEFECDADTDELYQPYYKFADADTYNSIYKETGNHGEEPFLKGFLRLEIPIYDKNYNSQWPERFSVEMIEAIKQRSGPNKFASQMMLTPVNIADGRLNPEYMKVYNEELQFIEGNGHCELRLCGKKLVSASCWWDPAYGSLNKGDSSVIACVFTDDNGEYWLHRIKYIITSPNSYEDEATQQCKIVADFAKKYSLPSIRLETNGIGKFLPGLLRKEISKTDFYCPVIEEHSNKPKHLRIIEAFDAPLAAGVLNCHESVYCSDFVAEMQEWQPINASSKDDGLDAVAGCLSSEPIRLPRFSQNVQSRTKQWKSNNYLKASLDFNI